MFCGKCGRKAQEGDFFCQICGTPLDRQSPIEGVPLAWEAPAEEEQTQKFGFNEGLNQNSCVKAIKAVAKSPVFMIAVIAYTLQILISLIGAFSYNNLGSIAHSFLNMLEQYGDVPRELYNYVDVLNSVSTAPLIIGSIIGLIPAILMCIGLWLIYTAGCDKHPGRMKTSGLTMVKVMNVISLVGVCLSAAFMLIIMVISMIAMASYDATEGIVVMAVILAVVAIIYYLIILYWAKVIKSINVAKSSITSGTYSGKASTFVAVICYIGAVLSVFGLITNFFVSLTSIVYYICFGITISKFNGAMTTVAYSNDGEI